MSKAREAKLSTLEKKVSWIPFLLGLLIVSATIVFVTYKDFATHATLKKSEELCVEKQHIHIFFYGGDEPSQRLEEVCKVFDRSMCPKKLHVHVLIPLQTAQQVTLWDTDMLSMCQSMPTYNLFFSENVHLHKYNYRKTTGSLSKTLEILRGTESIAADSLIVWLPSLVILEKHWDDILRKNLSLNAEHKFQVFPLLKYEPSSFLEVINSVLGTRPKAKSGYFFVNPLMLSLDVRELQQPTLGKSLGISLRYPFVCSKQTFLTLEPSLEQDLALSCFVGKTFGVSAIVHSSQSIGQTLIKNMPSREKSRAQLQHAVDKYHCEDWLSDIAIEASNNDFKVFGRAILGMTSSITLQEKIAKWGSEARYESTKEEVLF